MSTVIKTIKDFFGNITYPITKTNAVYDSNNNRLDNILTSKQDASSNFVYKGTGSATPSIDDPELRQSDISTTQSTSDTTVPSSSLVKTMNDNLGNPSSASAVTGADAFSKISKLNSDLTPDSTLATINTSVVASNSLVRIMTMKNVVFLACDANVLSGAADGSIIASGLPLPLYMDAFGATSKSFNIRATWQGNLEIAGTPSTGWVKGSIAYIKK